MIIMTALCATLFLSQTDEPYEWPLKQSRALTSSFAEYRSDRFHMGIDLRTGAIGKEVFAADDGYISRIRCSPYGYGKALYVQLDDGNTAIYAHLNDFVPEINEYVRNTQHRRKSYTVDLYPEGNIFRVQRGQLIGYSGQTGIGVPHLHWEIRDSSGVPINPRSLEIEWPDTTAPRFRSVLLIPTTPDTTINGDFLPVLLPVTRTTDGHYQARSARVKGQVALGVDVYDPANQGASKLGVYSITTTADDESIFHMTHDRVSYHHWDDGVVAYHPFYRNEGKFLMQWPWPGIKTELYAGSSGTGEISVSDVPRRLRVEAIDFFKHSKTLILQLNPDEAVSPSTPTSADTDSGNGTVFYNAVGDWLVVSVQFSAPESVTPVLLESGLASILTQFTRINATTFRARFRPESETTYVGISIDHPRAGRETESELPLEHAFAMPHAQGDALQTQLGTIGLNIEPEQIYSRLYLTTGIAPSEASEELKPFGDAHIIWPEEAPLRNGIEVSIPLSNTADSTLGLYRKQGESWQWVDATFHDEKLVFKTKKLGTFQLMTDSTAPRISFQRPAQSTTVQSASSEIRIHMQDNGSGIASWKVTYRNEWLLMAYDPEQNILIWERDKALPSGNGELKVSVRDKAGNTTVKQLTLTVP